MAAPSLDTEFMQYWSKLSIVQKESLLGVIKSFVQPDESYLDLEQYNREIDKAVMDVEKGEFYTQEEVEKMAKEW